MRRKLWKLSACDKDLAAQLAESCNLDPFLALLLTARGIADEIDAESYLCADFDFSDPFEYIDMEKAVARISEALDRFEKIAVFGDYDADGVIVTTPTGSTGYNLSAGGPLVEPNAELIMVTPICPHTLNQRSIILSPEDVVEIEILPGREDRVQTVEVNFDGSHVISLGAGDRVRVVKAQKSTEFIRLSKVSFLEVLHKKMAD